IGNPSLNHRYRKGFYSLFKTLQQNQKSHQLIVSNFFILKLKSNHQSAQIGISWLSRSPHSACTASFFYVA
ncbi:hypothetical protein, partial [Enterococcus faecium]|uniref:hypothetical protein n=1 Tax=Enterococcus faecium TaxID=1352 RepID=UPI001C92E8A1